MSSFSERYAHSTDMQEVYRRYVNTMVGKHLDAALEQGRLDNRDAFLAHADASDAWRKHAIKSLLGQDHPEFIDSVRKAKDLSDRADRVTNATRVDQMAKEHLKNNPIDFGNMNVPPLGERF